MRKAKKVLGDVTLAAAIEGYLFDAEARRLSPHTIADYACTFKKLQRHFSDNPPIASLGAAQLNVFFGRQNAVSKKTLLNMQVALSALWRWAVQTKLVPANVMREVPWVKPEERAIEPLTEADVRSILSALDKSQWYSRPGKRDCQNSLGSSDRNRAIVLMLLDTGLRASELCSLRAGNVDLKNRCVKVLGKMSKERIIPFSPQTGQAIWKYLAGKEKSEGVASAYLFTTASGRPMKRDDLLKLVMRAGDRAGVLNVHPHRFRHTFAINFLRNGGNIYALQNIMGHSTLEMVRRYLSLAQADVDAAHRIASPVANWRL